MHAIRNLDGRLEVFARGFDGALIHIWQVRWLFGLEFWSEWRSLGIPHPEFRSPDGKLAFGGLVSAPVAARNADGRLEVFAVGLADAFHTDLVHIWQTGPSRGPWSSWASLGGDLKDAAPAVIRNADGRLEVFARFRDNSLWHIWQTAPSNGWSSWAPLGGSILGAPTVIRNTDHRLEVFARGTDERLRHIWQIAPNGPWSQWASLGGFLSGAPSVGRNADGRLEVFAISPDSSFGLAHIWQTAPNNGWSQWAGDLLVRQDYEAPAVAPNADGRLELFGGGSRGGPLLHQWQTAPNNGWSQSNTERDLSLGGESYSAPAVVQNTDGRLEVFVRGRGRLLYHIWQTSPNNGWSGWENLGYTPISDVGRTLIEESGKIRGFS